MKTITRWNRGVPIVAVQEAFVSENGKAIGEAIAKLIADGEHNIILDLTEVLRVDSAGIGAIVRCFTLAQDAGAQLKLLHLSERVVKLLTTGHLLMVLEQAYEDEDEAVQSFSTTVHMLLHGQPLCGFSADVPRDWPAGHSFIAYGQEEALVTCKECKNASEGLNKKRG